MKKLAVFILAGIMVFSMAACGGNEAQVEDEAVGEESPITGAWEKAESPEVTDEIKDLVAKATEGMDGAEYTPVAYLSSQVVAGTNHAVLCKITPIVPDAVSTYSVVTIFEDLDGNATVGNIYESEAQAPADATDMTGAWAAPESLEVTEDAAAALAKATEGWDVTYSAEVLLATQVVAGTNYELLCERTVAATGATEYAIVTVYADLEGKAEVMDIYDFTDGPVGE